VQFPPDQGIASAVQKIPGALSTSSAGAWAVPADSAAAAALLQFAQAHDFDFLPSKRKSTELDSVVGKID